MYKVKIDQHEFEFQDSDIYNLDIIESGNGIHLLDQGHSQEITLLSCNLDSKKVVIDMNGKEYTATIADEFDQLVDKLGFTKESAIVIKDIKAPMPGLVLDILVTVGQSVEKGSQLVILEAMKMENVLKSQTDGVIKEIVVSKGEAVEKSQLLIVLE